MEGVKWVKNIKQRREDLSSEINSKDLVLGMSIKLTESNICVLLKSIPELKVVLNASNSNKTAKGMALSH